MKRAHAMQIVRASRTQDTYNTDLPSFMDDLDIYQRYMPHSRLSPGLFPTGPPSWNNVTGSGATQAVSRFAVLQRSGAEHVAMFCLVGACMAKQPWAPYNHVELVLPPPLPIDTEHGPGRCLQENASAVAWEQQNWWDLSRKFLDECAGCYVGTCWTNMTC
eukprot:SAG22_NODE_639_length_8255_cov_13.659882_11_plen_161_part_00